MSLCHSEEIVKLWRLRAGRRFVASRSPIKAYSRDQQITSLISDVVCHRPSAKAVLGVASKPFSQFTYSRTHFRLPSCCLTVGRLGGDESGEGWAVLWYHRIHTAYTERRPHRGKPVRLAHFRSDGSTTVVLLLLYSITNAELRLCPCSACSCSWNCACFQGWRSCVESHLREKKHQDDLEMLFSHTRTHTQTHTLTQSHSLPDGTHLSSLHVGSLG